MNKNQFCVIKISPFFKSIMICIHEHFKKLKFKLIVRFNMNNITMTTINNVNDIKKYVKENKSRLISVNIIVNSCILNDAEVKSIRYSQCETFFVTTTFKGKYGKTLVQINPSGVFDIITSINISSKINTTGSI